MLPKQTITSEEPQLSLSKESYLYMRMLASRCGIELDSYKKQAVYNRLLKRIRTLKLNDFDSYCALLRIDLEEEIKFINLVTNSTTYFFREIHHFDYLKETIKSMLPRLTKLRIWSAGCSTGEEPYTIALILKNMIPNIEQYDIKILATDVNSDSLCTAETGIYSRTCLDQIPLEYHWGFEKVDESLVKIKTEVSDLISFQQLNLFEPWPMQGPFDMIFCRNVLIYFKKDLATKILHGFDRLLATNGSLLIGYSDNFQDLKSKYKFIGKSIYQKT